MNFRGKNIDLVGKMSLWFSISLALIVIGVGSWAAWGLNLGIDFKGGGQYSYKIPAAKIPAAGQEVALIEQARGALEKQGLNKVRLQIAGGETLVVNTDALPSQMAAQSARVSQALAPIIGAGKKPDAQQSVGPVIGDELRRNAINGVVIGVLLIALWIYIRYNFAGEGLRYAVGGIVALVHDVLVLVGLFALIGYLDPRIEIDGAFIAALLTVVGYSINDSVVIFDRVRENLKLRRKEPYEKVINDSLLETMSRSINTGMTVLIMLFIMLMYGGESIYSFVLAMLVGIASGLYSSIFNASMVLVAWHRWDEKKAAAARAARAGAVRAAPARASSPRVAAPRETPIAETPRPVAAPPVSSAEEFVAPSEIARDENGLPLAPSAPASTAPRRPGGNDLDPSRRARAKRRF